MLELCICSSIKKLYIPSPNIFVTSTTSRYKNKIRQQFPKVYKLRIRSLISKNTTKKVMNTVKTIQRVLHVGDLETPVPQGAVKFSHSTRLGELNVKICDPDYDILNIHVSGFELDILFRANERFVFRSFLSSLNVEHLSDVTLYPRVRKTL